MAISSILCCLVYDGTTRNRYIHAQRTGRCDGPWQVEAEARLTRVPDSIAGVIGLWVLRNGSEQGPSLSCTTTPPGMFH